MEIGFCDKCRKIKVKYHYIQYGAYYGAGEWMCEECYKEIKGDEL